ncbi:prolyl aminopeptidase-2 [Trametes sanguinea]|nr:prolyl aminopeptidase-2 [Trametes sanguinea]
MVSPTTTGTVNFDAKAGKPCQTWYQVYGDLKSGVTPIVAIHGGPGSTHHYILSMSDLATKYSIPIVFYDQLGNGNSTHLPEKSGDAGSFWTEQLFLDELDNLLHHLGIQENYVLLGQSWGGMLAARHATRQPKGLKRLTVSDSPASMPLFVKAANEELIAKLPPDVRDAIIRNEEAGTTDSQEYKDAVEVFYKRHLCRLDPWPKELVESFEWMDKDPTVYLTMNGPSEFHVIGSLKNWSIIDEAHKINVPTLLLNGAYDEAADSTVFPLFKLIPKVKWFTFAESSHTPHWEEREKYMKIVAEFLSA